MNVLLEILGFLSLGVIVVVYFSLKFRHDYLRQKLLNRMTSDEVEQMNKTDLDFWSFLK
jgi:hypothetical protein